MDLSNIIPNKAKALFLAKRQLSVLVCDAVNLEGINYTLPEIQTLLDGVTVGGHKLNEQQIALNQAAAWHWLFKQVETNCFSLSKTIACQLHAIAGKQETLSWGEFRTGAVTIAGTEYYPPAADTLDTHWMTLLTATEKIKPVFDRAIFIFLQMARYQFFYDVNKRMGRFMMNGVLLSAGYPVINLPATKQLRFNELMLAFYQSGDVRAMTEFMKACLDARTIEIMAEHQQP